MKNNHINYIELKAKDLGLVKDFYSKSFGWTFTDYGPDYVAFSDSGLDGGFERSDAEIINGALVVLYHESLETIREEIVGSNGNIEGHLLIPGRKKIPFY